MFKRIVTAISLCMLAITSVPANAATGIYKGYFYGAKTPGEIAQLVESSLAKDSTGKTLLSEDNCRTRGGCARPIDYLVSFQKHDPQGAPKTLSGLSRYLRNLQIKHGFAGTYQMDRIVYGRGEHRADVAGMSRSFLKGEAAWVNPETGQPVLAENCANPVGVRIDLNCVYVDFESKDAAEYAVAWERIRRKDDPCFAFRKTTRLYEPDSPAAVWNKVRPSCIGKPCDFGPFNRLHGYPTQAAQGVVELSGPGTYQWRLSPDEILAMCMKTRISAAPSSFTAGVVWQKDYKKMPDAWHARVYYDTAAMKKDGLWIGQPKALMFWASNKQDETLIYSQNFGKR